MQIVHAICCEHFQVWQNLDSFTMDEVYRLSNVLLQFAYLSLFPSASASASVQNNFLMYRCRIDNADNRSSVLGYWWPSNFRIWARHHCHLRGKILWNRWSQKFGSPDTNVGQSEAEIPEEVEFLQLAASTSWKFCLKLKNKSAYL